MKGRNRHPVVFKSQAEGEEVGVSQILRATRREHKEKCQDKEMKRRE